MFVREVGASVVATARPMACELLNVPPKLPKLALIRAPTVANEKLSERKTSCPADVLLPPAGLAPAVAITELVPLPVVVVNACERVLVPGNKVGLSVKVLKLVSTAAWADAQAITEIAAAKMGWIRYLVGFMGRILFLAGC